MKWSLFFFLFFSCSHYPESWWQPVPKDELQWWEISPHEAKQCQVVLSKRNELGLLSNFVYTPFTYRGKTYPTVESLWQSMKYPENKRDIRYSKAKWPHTRTQVEKMESGFKAKEAGDFGTEVMNKMNINWVTFEGKQIPYRVNEKGDHYKIIKEAMLAKLHQNPKVKEVLLSTGDLNLLADHMTNPDDPPAWRYYRIWMEIRNSLNNAGDACN